MVKVGKNTGTIVLMVSSIGLLLILQLLWLRSSYQEERERFEKETNTLFRITIIRLYDSLIMQSIEPLVKEDSLDFTVTNGQTQVSIWKKKVIRHPPLPNNAPGTFSRIDVRDSIIHISLSATGRGDTMIRFLRPVVAGFRKKGTTGNFLFRFGQDSLRVEDIQRFYTDTLKAIGITLAPAVHKAKLHKPDTTQHHGFATEPFFLPDTPAYYATFSNIRPFLLSKVSPQIAFSIVLTSLIITAFLMMYRSMTTQQKLVQIKNDLISNITHELKTPVATVSVALEALQHFKAMDNPSRLREYLDMAHHELNRLLTIIDKILEASVFNRTHAEVTREVADLEHIIQEALVSFKLFFEKHQAQVVFNKPDGTFKLRGDSLHLTQVVLNLLDNAVKYSKPGCTITLTLSHTGSALQLLVEDNGTGIPQEYQQLVFEKFFRVPSGDVHNAKGYGLGLYYVARAVKAHGGSIKLKSEPGKGSTFILTFPAAPLA